MALKLTINGQPREFDELGPRTTLPDLIESLKLKSDRVALELNGEICPRSVWSTTAVTDGDRVEIVHFVGGGTAEGESCR